MGKHRGPKKEKSPPVYRTKEQRQEETRPILEKLTELRLTTEYEEVVTLLSLMREYIQNDKRTEINIPFPSINRRITGVLATNVREQVWVKMEKEQF